MRTTGKVLIIASGVLFVYLILSGFYAVEHPNYCLEPDPDGKVYCTGAKLPGEDQIKYALAIGYATVLSLPFALVGLFLLRRSKAKNQHETPLLIPRAT